MTIPGSDTSGTDGRTAKMLAGLRRNAVVNNDAPSGSSNVGAAGETLTVVFVADAAPVAVPLPAAGGDVFPNTHPYADLTGWHSGFLSTSELLVDAPAGTLVRIDYTPVGAPVDWQPLDGAAGPVIEVGRTGDFEGVAVDVAADAQRPVRLRAVRA